VRFAGRLVVIAGVMFVAGLAVSLSLSGSGLPVPRAHAAAHRRGVYAVSLAQRVRAQSLGRRADHALPLRPFSATAFEPADSGRHPEGTRETAAVSANCERRQGGRTFTAQRADAAASYPWPLKPFDRQHPIRGNFGDPRTFLLTSASSVRPAGRFSFHGGVDIVGKVGEPVFPVVSGRVVRARPDRIYVRSGSRLLDYWHLRSAVRLGEWVGAQRTVLGFIRPEWRHVHLGEAIDGRQVNPLLHLTPYADSTAPVVAGVRFVDGAGRTLDPLHLHGLIEIAAGVYDLPSPPVPGAWSNTPVAPALVQSQLTTLDGRTVLPKRTAVDFRWTLPEGKAAFWQVYAHDTYQNFPVVGLHYFYRQPGNYLFRLTRAPLDTRRLAPGRYQLIVDAADICGNHSSFTEQITTAR